MESIEFLEMADVVEEVVIKCDGMEWYGGGDGVVLEDQKRKLMLGAS